MNRLFQILYYLLNKGEATAAELADKFEVSVRTIYRDIDRLSGAGIPVYTTAGYKGGIHLDESFVLKKSVFSKEDMQNILMGVQSLSAVSFSESDDVLEKLQAIFRIYDMDWIEVDYSRWGCDTEKEKGFFGLLKKAVQERYQIYFKYYNASGEASERVCLPLKLVFKDRAWYLQAYCLKRKAMRFFRLSRIRELELKKQHFDHIPEEETPSLLLEEKRIMKIEVSFLKKAAYRVYDVFDEAVITETKDSLIVRAFMPEDEWLYGFLMSFGDGATVISPACLKEELKRRFLAALKHLEVDICALS